MKPSTRLALLAATFTVASAAQAQLKPPTKPGLTAPAAPAAQAAPASPAPTPESTEMANAGKVAAQAWLALLDRKDWGTAWDASSAVFRKNVPLGKWMDGVPKMREPFGAFVERQPLEGIYKTTLPGYPDGHYVSVMFKTKFEKKDDVQEVVTTVREADGRWRVTGYTAR